MFEYGPEVKPVRETAKVNIFSAPVIKVPLKGAGVIVSHVIDVGLVIVNVKLPPPIFLIFMVLLVSLSPNPKAVGVT